MNFVSSAIFQEAKIKIKKIVYRKKFNLGDYSNEDIELEAELEEGDNIKEALKKLKKEAHDLNRGEWFSYSMAQYLTMPHQRALCHTVRQGKDKI